MAKYCEVCGVKTKGGGSLCYKYRKMSQYSGFTDEKYKKPRKKK